MAYMLGDVCDAPFERLVPSEGPDPTIEQFLLEAWAAHLRKGVSARLTRRRYLVRLQVEAEVVEGEVHRLFVEIVRGSRESAFDAALFGALRSTGCLAGMPLAWSRHARAALLDLTFEVPDPEPDERALGIGEAFARQARDPVARLVRSGLFPAGRHDLPLCVARAPGDRWHVSAEGVPEPARSLVLGALAGAGLLAAPGDERLGEVVVATLRLVVRAPETRARTLAPDED